MSGKSLYIATLAALFAVERKSFIECPRRNGKPFRSEPPEPTTADFYRLPKQPKTHPMNPGQAKKWQK